MRDGGVGVVGVPGATVGLGKLAHAARPGWDKIPAVRDGELHEVKSAIILQPGPAALTVE